MTPERLAAFRKTFGGMSPEELRAIVEGRKPHKLSEETQGAIRLLLAERKGSGHQDAALLKPRASEERRMERVCNRTTDFRQVPSSSGEFRETLHRRYATPYPCASPQQRWGLNE